jgi:hypothetical protein
MSYHKVEEEWDSEIWAILLPKSIILLTNRNQMTYRMAELTRRRVAWKETCS